MHVNFRFFVLKLVRNERGLEAIDSLRVGHEPFNLAQSVHVGCQDGVGDLVCRFVDGVGVSIGCGTIVLEDVEKGEYCGEL